MDTQAPATSRVSQGPERELSEMWGEYSRRIRFLGTVGLFQDCPVELLANVAIALRPVTIAQDQVVFRAGDPVDQFYLIEEGTLAVVAERADQQHAMAYLGPG